MDIPVGAVSVFVPMFICVCVCLYVCHRPMTAEEMAAAERERLSDTTYEPSHTPLTQPAKDTFSRGQPSKNTGSDQGVIHASNQTLQFSQQNAMTDTLVGTAMKDHDANAPVDTTATHISGDPLPHTPATHPSPVLHAATALAAHATTAHTHDHGPAVILGEPGTEGRGESTAGGGGGGGGGGRGGEEGRVAVIVPSRLAPPSRPFPPELLAHPGDKDIQIDLRHLANPPPPAAPAAPVIFYVAAGFDSLLGLLPPYSPLPHPAVSPYNSLARSCTYFLCFIVSTGVGSVTVGSVSLTLFFLSSSLCPCLPPFLLSLLPLSILSPSIIHPCILPLLSSFFPPPFPHPPPPFFLFLSPLPSSLSPSSVLSTRVVLADTLWGVVSIRSVRRGAARVLGFSRDEDKDEDDIWLLPSAHMHPPSRVHPQTTHAPYTPTPPPLMLSQPPPPHSTPPTHSPVAAADVMSHVAAAVEEGEKERGGGTVGGDGAGGRGDDSEEPELMTGSKKNAPTDDVDRFSSGEARSQ